MARKSEPSAADTAAERSGLRTMPAWRVALPALAIFRGGLDKTPPPFGFMMQIAMLAGFPASRPIAAGLPKAGWKERM